ncbi:hypothetical protein BMF94_0299 [Rhodotorula taiwanensis]|uniref:Nascent polypeptide-associated complex subunit alpha-like UBA domain-containing protein n=1 Tax=Rhodotorula taiwanensis TaxID=741276 RepID=A0A2S5BIX2_9BASI|nr:hypothetical protein BMF94_0299 [Rhodotorula taiwanensis]
MLKAKAKAAATAAAQKRKEYWADSPATILAPGGSIQRIGYDQSTYEEAVRTIIFGEPMPEERKAAVGLIPPKEGSDAAAEKTESKDEPAAPEGYKTNKEDLAIILDEFDNVTSAQASQTLRRHKGDLAEALVELCAPRVSPPPAIRA